MSDLAISGIFESSLLQLHSSFSDDEIVSSNFFETESYRDFKRDQATVLAKPLEADDKQDGLLDFLDLMFRISVKIKQDGYDEELEGEKYHEKFRRILMEDNFFSNETVKKVRFLNDIGYKFTTLDINSLIYGLCDSSKKDGFNKKDWFYNIVLFADRDNLNPNERPAQLLSHEAFANFDDRLYIELVDLLIDLGADIYNSSNGNRTINELIRWDPFLIKHLLDNYPEFKEDKQRLLLLSTQALGLFINKHLGSLNTNKFKSSSVLEFETGLLKESFSHLSEAGIPVNSIDEEASPAQYIEILLTDGVLESGSLNLRWQSTKEGEEGIPILGPSLSRDMINNFRTKIERIKTALEL